MVAITLIEILQQFRCQEHVHQRGDTPHKTKRHMLLHSVGTHPSEEKYLKFAVTMRGGVLNNMSSKILNSAVPGETCTWPTVCPRLDNAPTTCLCPSLEFSHQDVWVHIRPVRWQSMLCHVQTHLGVQRAPCFLNAVIWSLWLTRFGYGDRSPKHDKASPTITWLDLREIQIGDDGARALADAVKAILVRCFCNRCAQAMATEDTRSSFPAFVVSVVNKLTISTVVIRCRVTQSHDGAGVIRGGVAKKVRSLYCGQTQK